MHHKLNSNNTLNRFRVLSALIILFTVSSYKTYALDDFYDWASGYKYRTDPAEDGTMDKENFFKTFQLIDGQWKLVKYVNMNATFDVSQQNWTQSYPACRSGELDSSLCSSDGQVVSGNVTFKYTCLGDVEFIMKDDNSSKNLVGGDTMYGAWSMLFNFFAPPNEEDCGAEGRCFVGNAFIVDTKAQKEANPGLFPAFGMKELVESPGEVYYFDQVRTLTQPPVSEFSPYNNIVLVGSAVEGIIGGACNLDICDTVKSMPAGTNAKTLSEAIVALSNTYMNPYNPASDLNRANFERCYYYVLSEAKKRGTDAASAVAVWVEESGASNCIKWPDVKDLGINMPPYPNIQSQAETYANLQNAYVNYSTHTGCRNDISPAGMTVRKYWALFYGGEPMCLKGDYSEIQWWFDQLEPFYIALHKNGSGFNWDKVLTGTTEDFGN